MLTWKKDNLWMVGHGFVMTGLRGSELEEAYHFFRKSVLDSLIPVNKPIGFKISSTTQVEGITAIDRHNSCLENMIQLAKNIESLIFVSPTGKFVSSEERVGSVYSGNTNFVSDGKVIEVLDDSIYLFNSLSNLAIRVFAHENTGDRSMEENATIIESFANTYRNEGRSFFPLNSYHTLVDYVKVLPFDGQNIQYRLEKDIKDSAFKQIWENYIRGLKYGR